MAKGNTRPEATPENDMGLVRDDMPMRGLQMVLKRSPEQKAAFEQRIADQHDPASANFHKWLTNAEVKEQFSPAAEDVEKVTDWLRAEGFRVDSASGMVIEFSGTAGQVRTAFHAPIHSLLVNGKAHFANYNDPEFPAAFAPILHGTASLHNFMPKPQHTPALKLEGEGYTASGRNDVTAGDLAKIYNFNPVFAQGISGRGQTVVVIEDTDLYSAGDWNVFRKVLGLSRAFPYGKLVQSNPTGTDTCTDPGANSDDVEAALDVEWASAAAPNATIVNAACDNTEQFGGFLALENLLEGPTPPTVVSISYGESEADLGSADNAYINNLYMTAAAEGTSVFVSSGDEGAASVDAGRSRATHGIQVSGLTSTPYNISVGGTDFGYIPLGQPNTYFSTTNSPFYVTAQSYIPEIPWNDSCASPLVATYVGRPTTGPTSYCNTSANRRTTAAGSGGPSACAYGDATLGDQIGAIISGNCASYLKPAFQQLTGVPNGGVRDIPDVSLFSSNGGWRSYYAFCYTDPTLDSGISRGGTPCLGDPATWSGAGGTSFASPIWAGIQALVKPEDGRNLGQLEHGAVCVGAGRVRGYRDWHGGLQLVSGRGRGSELRVLRRDAGRYRGRLHGDDQLLQHGRNLRCVVGEQHDVSAGLPGAPGMGFCHGDRDDERGQSGECLGELCGVVGCRWWRDAVGRIVRCEERQVQLQIPCGMTTKKARATTDSLRERDKVNRRRTGCV